MKLIDREPTEEMLFAARFYKEGAHTLACAWRAMYDAAPEVPVIEVHQWRSRSDGRWRDSTQREAYSRIDAFYEGRTLYTLPPNAQAEITKRDARIAELECILAPIQEASDKAEAAGRKALEWVDYAKKLEVDSGAVGVENQRLRSRVAEQFVEITRLKGVIAKCHSALSQCKQWQEGTNTLTCHNHEAVELALAAIKEMRNEQTL